MRVPLVQGAYSARSIIASAQRSVNIFGETNPPSSTLELQGLAGGGVMAAALVKGAPAAPITYYPCPGLKPLATPPTPGGARCLYRATSNDVYYVVGQTVYYVSPSFVFTTLGVINSLSTPCSMADNGTTAVLVDGTANGYQIDLATRVFSPITQAQNGPQQTAGAASAVYGFSGADRCDMIDGFMLFNQPGTRNFFCTYNNQIVFDATFFAAKNGFSDKLASVIVTKRQIWLIGERTTEIWFDAGDTGFPFEIVPGPFIQHGTNAKYSVAQNDGAIYFLSQDQAGQNLLIRGSGYEAIRVSNHALETEWSSYPTTNDAIGFCFQQNGHPFYQINFPTADRSWRYDESTQEWHEPVYTDGNGLEHRHRVQCVATVNGVIWAGDWQTGALYALDTNTYTDNGMPMVWRRGWPHLVNDGNRVRYGSFTADMECGDIVGTTVGTPYFPILQYPGGPGMNIGTPAVPGDPPLVLLRWSDDRGRTYGNPLPQGLGSTGEYLAVPQWNRLGMARDRVFELYGVIPGQMALNGAFIDVYPCDT